MGDREVRVIDAIDLGMEDILEMCAVGDGVANPVVRPLEGAQLYGEDVRKDEGDRFGWKAEDRVA